MPDLAPSGTGRPAAHFSMITEENFPIRTIFFRDHEAGPVSFAGMGLTAYQSDRRGG
jgi:hypothetical protein